MLVFKLWLSVQQNIGLYNIVELATTAIATAASATTVLLVVLLHIIYANHVIANFWQIPQISLPWQPGSVVEEFD